MRAPPRPVHLLLLLALLAPPAPAAAAPPAEPASIDCSAARVLASPGWPRALERFLPPGRPVEPLTLPLPEGPLLILGLLDSDPVARALGESLLGLDPEGDLGGGYVASGWRDGARTIGLLLGQDAAALAAARFELETFTPEPRVGAPRSVEFTKPDEQAGVRLALGRRDVRPRHRWRGLGGLSEGASALGVAAAHGNRLWITQAGLLSHARRLADHGVVPVATRTARRAEILGASAAGEASATGAWSAPFGPRFEGGLRHGALLLEAGGGPLPAAQVGRFVRSVWSADLGGEPGELLVIPEPEALEPREVPDLSDLPGALLGVWLTPQVRAGLTREGLTTLSRRAGAPLVLVEPWMAAAAGQPPRIPSLPRDLPDDLPDVVEGVLVLPGPGAESALSAAWAPVEDAEAFPELADLLAAAPHAPLEPRAFLERTADGLEQALNGRLAPPPWLGLLPRHLREAAAGLPPADQVVRAPLVPEPVALDGRLDDRAWRFAVPRAVGPLDLLALSDGHRLVLGLRLPDAARVEGVRVTLGPDPDRSLVLSLKERRLVAVAPPGLRVAVGRRGDAREVEVLWSHDDLGGDPYLTRRFPLDVAVERVGGQDRLAEPGVGALLVVR